MSNTYLLQEAKDSLINSFAATYGTPKMNKTDKMVLDAIINMGAKRVVAGEKAEWVPGTTKQLKFSKK